MFLLVFDIINTIIYVMREKKTRKLTCIVTGRALLATKEYYDRKVQKAGAEDKLHETYVCKEAKDLLKKGYDVEKARDILNIDRSKVSDISPDIIEDIINTSRISYRRTPRFNINNYTSTQTDSDVKKFLDNVLNNEK